MSGLGRPPSWRGLALYAAFWLAIVGATFYFVAWALCSWFYYLAPPGRCLKGCL